MYIPHLAYPFTDARIASVILASMYNAAMNMEVQASLQDTVFNSSEYICRRGTASSHGNSTFNFLRNLHKVFYSGSTIFILTKRALSVPIIPHPCQHLLSVILVVVILNGCEVLPHCSF